MKSKEELKTLKDIENMYIEVNATRQVSEVMKHIKVEAIKWVKFYQKKIHSNNILRGVCNRAWYLAKIEALTEFFNLTETEIQNA